jgi:L-asparaginase
MKKSCDYVAQNIKTVSQKIIFTGSMYPCYMQKDEATFNFATAIGALNAVLNGVYIAMHGLVLPFEAIEKDYANGKFYASKD